MRRHTVKFFASLFTRFTFLTLGVIKISLKELWLEFHIDLMHCFEHVIDFTYGFFQSLGKFIRVISVPSVLVLVEGEHNTEILEKHVPQ